MNVYQVQYLHKDGTWHIWATLKELPVAQEIARDLIARGHPVFSTGKVRIKPLEMRSCSSCAD